MPHWLSEQWPIVVFDREKPGTWSTPLTASTGTFRRILDNIIGDWMQLAQIEQAKVDIADPDDHPILDAIHEVHPRYVQFLFSYILFFLNLESAYKDIYASLNKLSRIELQLQLKPYSKPPSFDPVLYRKFRLLRNTSIAHWAEGSKLEDRAGASLGTYVMDPGDRLADIQFGGSWVAGAQNRALPGLPRLHQVCSDYIRRYDVACTEYLDLIKSHLPITIGCREYTLSFKEGTKAPW